MKSKLLAKMLGLGLLTASFAGCRGQSEVAEVEVRSADVVPAASRNVVGIPAGYQFLAVSAWGEFLPATTLYLKDEAGKTYSYAHGKLTELRFPEGYEFVGAREHGRFSSIRTYYCREKTTGNIVEMH